MLRSMSELEDYTIRATDGTIGVVKDVFFDDLTWVIRYLVVDTGTWLSRRKVLISPIAIGPANWNDRELPVAMSKARVNDSPDIDTEQPVSRQHEMQYLGHYGYPYYWGGSGLWGNAAYPHMLMTGDLAFSPIEASPEVEIAYARAEALKHQSDDMHLRSCKAVLGYHIHAIDGDIGHVKGMLIDEETWAVRYLIVDTSNWWLGHQVLIAPQWIKGISWSDATVSLNLSRQELQGAPAYDATVQLAQEDEADIYEYFGYFGPLGDRIESVRPIPTT